MTRKLSGIQVFISNNRSSRFSSHMRCALVAALEGQIPPADHDGVPVLTLRELLLILAGVTDTIQQNSQCYRESDIDHAQLIRSGFSKPLLRDLVRTQNTSLLNKDSITPDSALIIPEPVAAQRQGRNRKTPLIAWGRPEAAEGGGRAPDWQRIAPDSETAVRSEPLLEFLQPEPAYSVVYAARNESLQDDRANALSPCVPCPLERQHPLIGPGPAGPQPSGSPSAPASESSLPWQASGPPDETDSPRPAAGRRPRLRRHSAQPSPQAARREQGCAASAPPAGEPATSEPSGTDVRAMRTYSALIRQTREEDRAELETLGGQLQAARAALGVSRKQLVTLLHLDLELLVALEHGCGDVATARLVLERVSAIVERRRRAAAVQ